ncbi:MAG TPA: cytochrome ubiquinol oxidase subunit I [Bacteroidales bacterium]
MENFDYTLIDWSRAQFALTAIYHWFFVPLTLGLAFIVAIMETIYVRTGQEEWKRITKFWMTLFGINFAIGIATGIILEFEFGTNWSNYSWFVGDIFGAPLAIEGIMAFFLESTFVAVMFFGWNKVSKQFHLLSSWLTAIGASLSALWILVANAWMQYPAGMRFNPDTARNEMENFWAVLFSPVAVNKFLHTVSSSYVVAAIFVIGVSSWFLLKKRDVLFAKRSIIVASVFGLIMALFMVITGDGSARAMAKYQPMKFAAMENLQNGRKNAPLVAFGILKTRENDEHKREDFMFKIEIPDMLSYLAFLNTNAFVPGITDLVYGNEAQGIIPYKSKMEKGKIAIAALREYTLAKKANNMVKADSELAVFQANYEGVNAQGEKERYFGYGYISNEHQLIPPVQPSFYSFRIMVGLGFLFIILFILMLSSVLKHKIENRRWLQYLGLWTIPLAYLATQAGWIVAEVGRQPWVIQDLMPTMAAVSHLESSSVMITFMLFAVLFTALLIAEIKILSRQIKIGPKEGGR